MSNYSIYFRSTGDQNLNAIPNYIKHGKGEILGVPEHFIKVDMNFGTRLT